MVLEDPEAFARIVASIVQSLEIPASRDFAMARD